MSEKLFNLCCLHSTTKITVSIAIDFQFRVDVCIRTHLDDELQINVNFSKDGICRVYLESKCIFINLYPLCPLPPQQSGSMIRFWFVGITPQEPSYR